jgi:hypothetical protein
MVWIGLIWLRIWIRWRGLVNTVWTLGFHEMLGNSRVAAQFVAFQEGFSFMMLVEGS